VISAGQPVIVPFRPNIPVIKSKPRSILLFTGEKEKEEIVVLSVCLVDYVGGGEKVSKELNSAVPKNVSDTPQVGQSKVTIAS